jgi:hypothetical protein
MAFLDKIRNSSFTFLMPKGEKKAPDPNLSERVDPECSEGNPNPLKIRQNLK